MIDRIATSTPLAFLNCSNPNSPAILATRAATLTDDGLFVVLLRRRGIVNAACRGVGVVATRETTRVARLAAVRIAAVEARRAWRGSIAVEGSGGHRYDVKR